MAEICSNSEKYFSTWIYHSPSQSHYEFENACANVDLLFNNINDEFPIHSTVAGDFSTPWWKNDIIYTLSQETDSPTSSGRYAQIIDKPSYVVNNSMSCIDLMFCTNKNITSNHGVDATIFKKCCHNMIYGKINIRVPLSLWDYSKANIENIEKSNIHF